jgi:hypothetical protein
VQVGEAAFDDPAVGAQVRSVFDAASGDHGFDPASPHQAPVLVVVVAAVSEDHVGLLAGPAVLAGDRSRVQIVEQRHQLGHVVAVAAGQLDGQRDARRVDEQMVLGARAGTVNRGWPGQEPPKSARI